MGRRSSLVVSSVLSAFTAMHCSKFGFSLKVAIAFISSSWALAGRAAAQSPAELPVVQPIAEAPPRRNAIRFDVGGILASNFAYNTLNNRPEFLFPVLASYERSVGRHSSVVMEGLLNGGEPTKRSAGVSVQGRYYCLLRHPFSLLSGVYVAPVLGYRSVAINGYYLPDNRRHLIGAGALVGWQVLLSQHSRVFIDASLGVMAWKKVGTDDVGGSQFPQSFGILSYYERAGAVADGRLGIGFRF